MARGPKPLVINFDVEPTPRHGVTGVAEEWDAFPAFVDSLPALRRRVSDLTGHPMNLCWSMRVDYQIEAAYGATSWGLVHFNDAVKALLNAGDGIGMHPHPYRWHEGQGWFQDFGDEEW